MSNGSKSKTKWNTHSCASSFKVYWRKDKLAPAGAGLYQAGSIVSPLLAYGAGDFSQNVMNYWTKEDKIGFSWSKVYANGFKSFFKIDFFTGGSVLGFNTFNNIYSR